MVHNTATLSNLEPGASYVVQVVAKGDGLISKDSVAAKKTIKTVALVQLPQPTITQTEIFYREANVAWQNDPRAIGYLVLWRTAKEKSWRSAHVSSGITDYYITGLEPGTSYQVKVVAIGDHFQTRNSSETKYKTIKTKAPATLEQPSIIGYAASKHELGIKWLAVQGAVGYRVEWRAANEKTWRSTHYLLQEAAHDLTEREPNTSYVVRVIAVGDGYETLDSTDKKTKTYKTKKADAPLTQPDIIEYSVAKRALYVKWREAVEADGYRFEWRAANDKTWSAVCVEPTRTEFTLTNLNPNTSYVVRVIAVGNGSETLDSTDKKTKTYKTLPLDVLEQPTITETKISPTRIEIYWNPIEYANGYTVNYKRVGTKDTVSVSVDISTYSHEERLSFETEPDASYIVSVVAKGDDRETCDSSAKKTVTLTAKEAVSVAEVFRLCL